jgi:hypothetical protein
VVVSWWEKGTPRRSDSTAQLAWPGCHCTSGPGSPPWPSPEPSTATVAFVVASIGGGATRWAKKSRKNGLSVGVTPCEFCRINRDKRGFSHQLMIAITLADLSTYNCHVSSNFPLVCRHQSRETAGIVSRREQWFSNHGHLPHRTRADWPSPTATKRSRKSNFTLDLQTHFVLVEQNEMAPAPWGSPSCKANSTEGRATRALGTCKVPCQSAPVEVGAVGHRDGVRGGQWGTRPRWFLPAFAPWRPHPHVVC